MSDNKQDQSKQKPTTAEKVEKKPNEYAGYYFSSSLKITDPDSGKVILHMRCD